jgi:hypothetical protein
VWLASERTRSRSERRRADPRRCQDLVDIRSLKRFECTEIGGEVTCGAGANARNAWRMKKPRQPRASGVLNCADQIACGNLQRTVPAAVNRVSRKRNRSAALFSIPEETNRSTAYFPRPRISRASRDAKNLSVSSFYKSNEQPTASGDGAFGNQAGTALYSADSGSRSAVMASSAPAEATEPSTNQDAKAIPAVRFAPCQHRARCMIQNVVVCHWPESGFRGRAPPLSTEP